MVKQDTLTSVETLVISPAAEWRKPRETGVPFHFPSGMIALVRPVGMDAFLAVNEVTDSLTGIVAKLVNGQASVETMPITEFQKALDMVNAFCKACFVSPRIVDEITDPKNEILIDDVDYIDRQTLFNFVGSPASSLASFRPFKEESMERVVGSEGDGTNP